jgi:hypothetical protein
MLHLLAWCFLWSLNACAIEQARFGFDGFVKQVTFWDSRQVVAGRETDYTFFPKERKNDVQGCDINAAGDFAMWAMDTTLSVTVSGIHLGGPRGPNILGKVAVNFLGTRDQFLDMMELTFGFVALQWEKSQLLCGQMTVPTFLFQVAPNSIAHTLDIVAPAFQADKKAEYDDPIPRTVSYAYGSPMEPFAYVPLIRFMHTFSHNIHMLLSAQSEIGENASVGFLNTPPEPFVLPPSAPSSQFLHNSKTPVFNAQLHKYYSNESVVIGGVQYRRIQPRLVTDLDFKTNEVVNALTAYAAVKLRWDPVTTIIKCYYTQNGFADGNLGTYAIRTINPLTHEFTYTPFHNLSVWLDCRPSHDGRRYIPGIFAGFFKNFGTTKPMVDINQVSPRWGFTSYKDVVVKGNQTENNQDLDIDWMIKIVPRLFVSFKRFQIGAELEYHYVRFGDLQRNGRVTNTYPVNHVRFLTGFFYYF